MSGILNKGNGVARVTPYTYEFLYKSDFRHVVDRLIINSINFECQCVSSPEYYILKIKGKQTRDVQLLLRGLLNAQEKTRSYRKSF